MPEAPTRWVIVDDTSAGIEYTGDWSQSYNSSHDNFGNFGPTYNRTSHFTTTNATIQYKFKGTHIIVYGTNNVLNGSGVINPSWECNIDANSVVENIPASISENVWENNWRLCEKNDLDDQEHILTLYARPAAVHPQEFWFDRILYAPSASVPLDNETIYVESNDPALNFSNGWGMRNLISNITHINGSELKLEFYGTSLSWYGTLWDDQPTRAARAYYTVDDQSPTTFELTGLPPRANKIPRYNEKFFETPTYPAGRHILNVKYQGNAESVPLVLDYLIIQNGTAPVAVTPVATTPVATTPVATVAPVATLNPIPPSSKSSTNNTSAIAGGVVGGVVFTLFVILAFVIFRRRRNKRPEFVQSQLDNHAAPPSVFTPANNFSPEMAITQLPTESARNVLLDTRAITDEHHTVRPFRLADFFPAPLPAADGQQNSGPATPIDRGQISEVVLNDSSSNASRIVFSATDSSRRVPRDNAVEVEFLPPHYTYH